MRLFSIAEDSNEEWRDIVGYEGAYQVSNLGRVKSLTRIASDGRRLPGRLLTPTGSRYKSVALHRSNKISNKLVHRMVAEAFIPNPDNLPEVNHKDSNTANNHVENLEWVSASTNHQHSVSNRKKHSYRVKVKCLETGEIFHSISAAGRSVDADATQIIESIEAGRCCKGFTFVYADNLPEDPESYLKNAHNRYQNYHYRPKMSNARAVRCKETGEVFDSIAAAARHCNCDTSTISNRIAENRTVNGVTLEYLS